MWPTRKQSCLGFRGLAVFGLEFGALVFLVCGLGASGSGLGVLGVETDPGSWQEPGLGAPELA